MERADRRVLALEVKLSNTVTDSDVGNLVWLRENLGDVLVDAAVIHTGPRAYRRKDGIAVVPAALLGPQKCRPAVCASGASANLGVLYESSRSMPVTRSTAAAMEAKLWDRPKVDRETLQRLSERSTLEGSVRVVVHLGLIVATGWLTVVASTRRGTGSSSRAAWTG